MSRLTPDMHPSLTPLSIQALHSKQIFTVLDFIKADVQLISKTTRFTFKEVLAVRKSLLVAHSATPKNGFDSYRMFLGNGAIISTGIERLDQLLDGGLYTGNIYEICGLPGSGKTHFVMSLLKKAICNFRQTVHFLDTKFNFVASRMKEMIENECNNDNEKVIDCLDRIVIQRINTKHDLLNSLHEIKDDLKKNHRSESIMRLVIIDSLPALLLNSLDAIENNAFLNHTVNVMRYISIEYHVVFLITNIITTWNEGNFKNMQNTQEKIACGKYWLNVPNVRLKLEKINEKFSVIVLKNHSALSDDVAVELVINNNGFE